MNIFTILSFVFFTSLVAIISWSVTRKENLSSNDGYFLGGRSLSGVVIAGSLLLTNLSTEQLVGMNGNSFNGGLTVMAWEAVAGITLIFMALIFLPRYLKSGITTVPEYLEDRYDKGTRNIITILFLISLVLILLPTVLYSGGIALNSLFQISETFNLTQNQGLIAVIWGIGIIGGIYAIFGGLKAVAVSDTINGVGLLIGGLLVPFFGLRAIGNGNTAEGIRTLIIEQSDKLNVIGGSSDPVPFSTLFTGMLLINIFYWCTNQAIVQRTFAAKNLAEGQKGVLYAAFFKMFAFIILCLPGIIALQMFGKDAIPNGDLSYSVLVSAIMPKPLVGFFGAVLFGAVLSSFNSALNSASTLFCLNIYKPIFNEKIEDKKLVFIGKVFGTIVVLVAVLVAPFLEAAPQGLFLFMKMFMGFINIPILVIIVVGFSTRKVPAIAAKIALITFIVLYAYLQFVYKPNISFLHVLGFLFVLCVSLMLVIGRFFPRETAYVQAVNNKVSLEYWDKAYSVSAIIVTTFIYIYVVLSPLGVIGLTEGIGTRFGMITAIYIVISFTAYKKFLPKSKLSATPIKEAV